MSDGASQASSLTGTFDALVEDLESEVASGKLEIQRMRDGIHVNLANDVLVPTGVIFRLRRDALGRLLSHGPGFYPAGAP